MQACIKVQTEGIDCSPARCIRLCAEETRLHARMCINSSAGPCTYRGIEGVGRILDKKLRDVLTGRGQTTVHGRGDGHLDDGSGGREARTCFAVRQLNLLHPTFLRTGGFEKPSIYQSNPVVTAALQMDEAHK